MWVNGPRMKTNSDEQVVSPEEPSLLGRQCGGLEPGRLENIGQEVTMLLEISFREMSQQ